MNEMRSILRQQEVAKTGHANEYEVARRIKEICTQHLFGIDINPFLVRTCQMNLVMHGDGSANVYQADSYCHRANGTTPTPARDVPVAEWTLSSQIRHSAGRR